MFIPFIITPLNDSESFYAILCYIAVAGLYKQETGAMDVSSKDLITQTEEYVKGAFENREGKLLIAHGFSHVDRVRKWSLRIAKGESFDDLLIVELAALLHDIGLPQIENERERNKHGQVGAEIAGEYLTKNSNLSKKQIEKIIFAIGVHTLEPTLKARNIEAVKANGKLAEIICDADVMDAIGAVGIMRAFTSKYSLPEYEPGNVKGETWGLSGEEFTVRIQNGPGVGKYIIDQINFQISYPENLLTKTARNLAEPLAQFMKQFVLQLDNEINYV
jgi:uncharacterized protein